MERNVGWKSREKKNVGFFLSPYITFYGYKNIGQKNHFSEIGNFLFLLSDRETSSCNKGTITEAKFFPVLGPLSKLDWKVINGTRWTD